MAKDTLFLTLMVIYLTYTSNWLACAQCKENSLEKEKNTSERLSKLREILVQYNLSAYIITDDDDHQSEYVAEHDQRRKFISGFTGSAGDAVVTLTEAALWTDSRYYIQAGDELDSNWQLMKAAEPGTLSIVEWLSEKLLSNSSVSADPKTTPYALWQNWKTRMDEKNIFLVEIENNLIDEIWGANEGRPPYSTDELLILSSNYTGVTWQEKLQLVRDDMKKLQVDTLIVSALDEVAWVLNMRGNDVPFTPVFRSYLAIHDSQTILYVSKERNTEEVQNYLKSENYTVSIKNYEDFWTDLPQIGANSNKIALPSPLSYAAGVSYLIHSKLPFDKIINTPSPLLIRKDKKNAVEATGMRLAHIRDAIALCQFLHQLERDIADGSQEWTELKAVNVLNYLRTQQPLSMGPSFGTIAAYGIHAASPHYEPNNETDAIISDTELFLLDSGGQYLDGTTDVTRTVHFGKPRPVEIQVYTQLLIGCINLATVVFPAGKSEGNLEILLRAPLYSLGLDYGHGSTHGIGSFLAVHEAWNTTYHEAFFGSQEPGYYEENNFGMRLENIVTVIKSNVTSDNKYLTFDTVTLVPYDRKLVNVSMLEERHINWLNNYNTIIREKVGNEMLRQGLKDDYNWLLLKTEPFVKVH